MAGDMLSFYHGDEPGNTPGLLPDPYYCTRLSPFQLVEDLSNTKVQGGKLVP